MVDAGASFELRAEESRSGSPARGAARSAALDVVCLGGPEGLEAYSRHSADALVAPPQSAHWVRSWARNCNPDMVFAFMRRGGATEIAFALEVVSDGALRVARFAGGTHANGNFPALARHASGQVDREAIAALAMAIRRVRPDVDLVMLERQVDRFEGHENPFRRLPSWPSPNPALAVDLSGGFEAVLDRASGKRKRKKHRSQTRKFEAAGGFRRIRAGSRDESDRLLADFFAMKSIRFAAMGIRDVFAEESVRSFFRDLFGERAASPSPAFVLHGLEVGGRLRAVTGCSLTESTIICEFGSIAEDELAGASPGEFLFYDNIREACEAGLSVYDFSVGDEGYKRLWCDMDTRHFDIALPLTAKGHAGSMLRRAGSRAKRFLKENRFTWAAIRRFRRRAKVAEPAPDE